MEVGASPLLSVIITVYGTERYLKKCIESVLHSTYRQIEIVIVDDGSPGNAGEIANEYQKYHENLTFIRHERNRGLFQARVTGVEHSRGDYIAFLDSDDHVSCDFYRRLVEQAVQSDSDMVAGEVYLEYGDGRYQYQNLAHTRVMDMDLRGRAIADMLFAQQGKDYNLHVVWNKIYSKTLWDRCYPHFAEFAAKAVRLVMCEDVFFSSFFYYFAQHYTNIHGDFYYYFKGNEEASTTAKGNIEKYMKTVRDIRLVFSELIDIFQNRLQEEAYTKSLRAWSSLIRNIWKKTIERASFSREEKEDMYALLYADGDPDTEEDPARENYFYHLHTDVARILAEELKLKIIDPATRVVSFDLFDTLVVRPFYHPTDLFCLLDVFANDVLQTTDKVDFKRLRIDAEWAARQESPKEEITLDEIYASLARLTAFDEKKLAQIKQKEINLEVRYCMQRRFAKELYDLALYMGKKVIITSDMYLPQAVVTSILHKNGYTAFDKLYLSSVIGATKHTGRLFSYVSEDLRVKPDVMLHIGDNLHSDIKRAQNSGWQAYLLPKPISLLMNEADGMYTGEAFRKVYRQSFLLRRSDGMLNGYFGLRAMLGVIANKIFDNPFQNIHTGTDFNADPRWIGYGALGMHVFAIADWLARDTKTYGYTNVNFFARDGYIPMRAFERLKAFWGVETNVSYLPFTRSSLLPLQIQNREDFLSLYGANMYLFNKTPRYFVELFRELLQPEFYEAAPSLCEQNQIAYEKPFGDICAFSSFVQFLWKYWDEQKAKAYRRQFGRCFAKCFAGKSANFDIGYSCRIDYALKKEYHYDISSYFIHINGDIAQYRAQNGGISLHTFYSYSPGVTGTLREYLLSKIEPSCEKIRMAGDTFQVVEKQYEYDYLLDFSAGGVQRWALAFVEDMIRIFGEDMAHLYYQRDDVSMIHEYFNAWAKPSDRLLFSGLRFEDDLGSDGDANFLSLWNGSINAASYNFIRPLWKQALVLFFIDRALLKSKVKRYWAGKPLRLALSAGAYKLVRALYRRWGIIKI